MSSENDKISNLVEEALSFVFSYASSTDDWLKIKKELLKTLPPSERVSFSKRDPVTKKQVINEFDVLVAFRWKQLTGKDVILRQDGHEKNITA